MKPSEVNIHVDMSDPKLLGKPKYFDPDHYLDSVEQMVSADEVITALEMIDKMPGYYRQYPYPRAVQLKKELYQQIWNLASYTTDEYETYENSLKHQSKLNIGFDWDKGLGTMIDIPFCYPRGPLAIQTIKKLNDDGKTPHIFEMGPANYYLPYGLHLKGCKFTYYADTLNRAAFEDHSKRLKDLGVWKEKPDQDQIQVFICFETIEHLWNLDDIIHQYHRYQCHADYILMSTPCNTLLGGVADYKRDLGHLRTFTPRELFLIASKWWPEFDWEECLNHMMVLCGRKKI